MSQPPPSYPVPPGYPPHQPPPPRKPRPSGWWFVVGGGLVVVAGAAAVGLFLWALWPLLHTDASVPADGQPHLVTVSTDGDRMLWRHDDVFDPSCEITDARTGEQVRLQPVTSQVSRDFGDGGWTAAYRFDPGSGHLEVVCDRGGSVEIGAAPTVGGVVAGLLLAILVPGLVGLVGLATLVVTGILWTTRPARQKA
jgi:hypothetical protein